MPKKLDYENAVLERVRLQVLAEIALAKAKQNPESETFKQEAVLAAQAAARASVTEQDRLSGWTEEQQEALATRIRRKRLPNADLD